MEVQGQHRQIVLETPISKMIRSKWTGGCGSSSRVSALSVKIQVQIPVIPKKEKKEENNPIKK
jgi:hypothetical protein